MTKQFYETPTTKTLVVRFQGMLCGSPDGKWDNSIKGGSTWGSSAYDNDDNPYGLE